MFDSVDLITYGRDHSNRYSDKVPIRQISFRDVPREVLMKNCSIKSPSIESPMKSSIIFLSKSKSPLGQSPVHLSPTGFRPNEVERALFDFYRCSQVNDLDETLTNSESDLLSNYKEIDRNNVSDFLDEPTVLPCQSTNLMKFIVMTKNNLETTSDERTLTNSVSLNTYSQDFSIDRIFRPNEQIVRRNSSSSESNSSRKATNQNRNPIDSIDKKRTTSSDSDGVTTTTTTLTGSTVFGK